MDVSKRAKVLIQAMPYIKKYSGETIVVKYGGNAMINEELKAAVMSDLVLMQLVGVNVVLVHGGGPEINAMLKAVGKESKFINGMRVTDKETIDIVQMVLAGKVNKSLVQLLGSHGGKAMGLCGLDGRMLMAEKLVTGADLGYVGEIKEVNPEPLNNALASGYIPIVSTVAGGYDGNVYNINADIAASQIAAKIGAKKLILMTDIRGLLRDVMAGVPPYILVRHIYACASIVGAIVCVVLYRNFGAVAAMVGASAVVILIRYLAAHYRWNLPKLTREE